jgi:hypothetical protein
MSPLNIINPTHRGYTELTMTPLFIGANKQVIDTSDKKNYLAISTLTYVKKLFQNLLPVFP